MTEYRTFQLVGRRRMINNFRQMEVWCYALRGQVSEVSRGRLYKKLTKKCSGKRMDAPILYAVIRNCINACGQSEKEKETLNKYICKFVEAMEPTGGAREEVSDFIYRMHYQNF